MSRYIDADKLKESFNASVTDIHHADFSLDLIWEYIDEQPTADVRENIKGEWIKYAVDIAEHPYHCSNCGYSNKRISHINELLCCPNCGADMREVHNGK